MSNLISLNSIVVLALYLCCCSGHNPSLTPKRSTTLVTAPVTILVEEPTQDAPILEPTRRITQPMISDFEALAADKNICAAIRASINQPNISLRTIKDAATVAIAEQEMRTIYADFGSGEVLSIIHTKPWFPDFLLEVRVRAYEYFRDSTKLENLYRKNRYCIVSSILESENKAAIKKFLDEKLIPTFDDDKWSDRETWSWRQECMRTRFHKNRKRSGGVELVRTWAYIFGDVSKSLD